MRSEHEFQFKASEIAEAARAEAEYHEDRLEYWGAEFDASFERVEATIGATIKKQHVTGGERFDVAVDYGDPAAYRRMIEAQAKIDRHRDAAEQFRTDEKVYGTQGERVYELSVADVHYYRLGAGRTGEEA
jgi:hypothetical protein